MNHNPSNVPGATTRGAIASTYKRGIANTRKRGLCLELDLVW
jgi:hypothetical protein